MVGRDDELERVADLLTGTPNSAQTTAAVAIVGAPGIGKTELARAAARGVIARSSSVQGLFVDMRGYDPDPAGRVAPEDLYASLLRALGLSEDQIPASAGEQATVYHHHMADLARRRSPVLLVLDNVSDAAQIIPLIPPGENHRVLVTSRDTFGGVVGMRNLELDVLQEDAAVRLMTDATQQRDPLDNRLGDDRAAALELARLCGHLPLALQIVAAMMADEPDRPLLDLVSELDDESTRLSGLDYDKDWSVRAAFTLSYRRLEEDAAELFRLLPLVPGGDISLRAAAALTNEQERAIRRKLMRLVRAHLVDKQIDERWRMHDLIRLYATELPQNHRADDAFRRMIMRYIVDFMAATRLILDGVVDPRIPTVFISVSEATRWFNAERTTLVAITRELSRRTDYQQVAVELGRPLCTVLQQFRLLDDQVTVAALWASTAASIKDAEAEVLALNNLGGALRQVRRFDEAIEVHERARENYRVRRDRRGEGVAMTNMANVLQDLGRYDEAIRLYSEDVVRCDESEDEISAAHTLTNLAGVLIMSGRACEALSALQRPLDIFERHSDREGQARTSDLIGSALQKMDDVQGAAAAHRRAATLFGEVNRQFSRSGALNNLALALMASGDARGAAEIHQEQFDVLDQLGDRYRRGIALNNFGQTLTRLDRIGEAIDAHSEAVEIFAHFKDLKNEGTAHLLLGVAFRNHNEKDKARAALQQAQTLFDEVGAKDDAAEARQILSDLG
ncbi:hypothetical protein WSS_A40040 [Rhodococcus opacus M213]|uniref:AAA+ ATPase domain-containing protein n=1 Tax=Rhodococcus opacus M213 TaxID=1129896 RepID=K8XF91_RHOOP|nr:hypothetical protein WSS_A40040 [Rhodococcus opacus M213]